MIDISKCICIKMWDSLGDASTTTQHTESVFFHVQITLKRAICLFNSIFENKHLNPLLKFY